MEGKILASMPLESLLRDEGVACSCKRLRQSSPVRQIEVGKNILLENRGHGKGAGNEEPCRDSGSEYAENRRNGL